MHWYSDNMGKGQTLSLIYAGVLLKERQLKGKVKLQMALYKKLYLIVKCSYSLHVPQVDFNKVYFKGNISAFSLQILFYHS